jgi:hypothetical protein
MTIVLTTKLIAFLLFRCLECANSLEGILDLEAEQRAKA